MAEQTRHGRRLHDIGFAEGRKGHHKTGMRYIEEDLSLNISDADRPLVALLARYHRKAWPSRRHSRFAALPRRERRALRRAGSPAAYRGRSGLYAWRAGQRLYCRYQAAQGHSRTRQRGGLSGRKGARCEKGRFVHACFRTGAGVRMSGRIAPRAERCIGIIDLGSNSLRLLIVRIHADGSTTVLNQVKHMVRLGEGGFVHNRLQDEAMNRTLGVLRGLAEMCAVYETSEIVAIATAAVRDAENGQDFILRVREKTGIDFTGGFGQGGSPSDLPRRIQRAGAQRQAAAVH